MSSQQYDLFPPLVPSGPIQDMQGVTLRGAGGEPHGPVARGAQLVGDRRFAHV